MTRTLTDAERLQLALDAGRMGTWSYNLRTGEQHWDQRQFELLGLPGGTWPTREAFVALVLPEDLANIEIGPDALATENYRTASSVSAGRMDRSAG